MLYAHEGGNFHFVAVMRYSPMIGHKLTTLKAAMEGSYRWLMLGMMAVELILLAVLVVLEVIRR